MFLSSAWFVHYRSISNNINYWSCACEILCGVSCKHKYKICDLYLYVQITDTETLRTFDIMPTNCSF
jgi:hypothetical protein